MEGTFGEYARRWLDERCGLVRESTYRWYETLVLRYMRSRWFQVQVEEIDKRAVWEYLSQSSLSLTTVRQLGTLMKSILELAVEDGAISTNPAADVCRKMKLQSRAMSARNIKAFNAVELARFLESAVRHRYRVEFLTLAWTGIRVGELGALTTSDVDLAARLLHIYGSLSDRRADIGPTKSGNTRFVEMPDELASELHRYLCDERQTHIAELGFQVPWLFFTERGNPVHQCFIQREFKALLHAADLPAHHTPHSLRHTYASLLLQQGVDIAYVARQLGHSSVAVTELYYGRWLPLRRPEALGRLTSETSPLGKKDFAARDMMGSKYRGLRPRQFRESRAVVNFEAWKAERVGSLIDARHRSRLPSSLHPPTEKEEKS